MRRPRKCGKLKTIEKIGCEISEGMLFDIGYADGIIPVLARPEKPVPNGTRVG